VTLFLTAISYKIQYLWDFKGIVYALFNINKLIK
jgi:hypothetical protein